VHLPLAKNGTLKALLGDFDIMRRVLDPGGLFGCGMTDQD
jgi:hypothetical protein